MPGSLERIPVKHLGYAESNPFDAVKRSWMMEESGPDGANRFGSMMNKHQTEPLLPTTPEQAVETEVNPGSPKVLGELEQPAITEKPRVSIGLGR
jgi:hypothetical protein